MRILAIRGRNLASLYGDFELSLERGPIAEAGLFSIAGPTGAGKSTLIDALCLALYCETPRFDARATGVRPGRPDQDDGDLVDANDRRNLLSRGTGDGHAEVDFEGTDERRWRARWEIRRARGKADGRLQKEQLTLCALDGAADQYSGLAEVKRRIVELVGYTFDEFRRAVVLPQFEFRAFLDADPNTRAAILERVTGTEIYGRLSQRAHERAAEARTARDAVLQRVGDVQPLAPAERRALEDRAAAALAARAAAGDAARAAEADVRWLVGEVGLGSEVTDAEQRLAEAGELARAAESRRGLLFEVEAAEKLRPIRSEVDRTSSDAETATSDLRKAERALDLAAAARAQRAAARDAARAALAAALAERERLWPELDTARALDVRLDGARRRAGELEAALANARADRDRAAEALQGAERRSADARARRGAAADWLGQRGAERTLAAEWPRWKALLRDHWVAVRDLAAAASSAETWRETLAMHTARADELRERLARRRSAFDIASARLEAALASAGNDDLAALAARVKSAGERQARAVTLLEAVRQARVAADERERAAAEAGEAGKAIDALAVEERDVAGRARVAEARLGAAEEALARLNVALSLEARRSELRDGEACPLCGATEHPYEHGAPGKSALAAQSGAVAEERSSLEGLRAEGLRIAERIAAERQQAAHAAQTLARQQRALSDAEGRYAALRVSGPEAALPASAAAALEAARAYAARAAAEAEEAQAVQSVALERTAIVEGARSEEEKARGALESVERELASAEVELARDGGLLKEAEERARGLTGRRDAIESDLEPVLAFRRGWREQARGDAIVLVRACEAIAGAHAEWIRTVEETEAALIALEAERESARVRLDERTDSVETAAEAAEGAREAARILERERGLLLGGRLVHEVEAALTVADRTSRAAAEAAGEQLSRAEQELAVALAGREASERLAAAAAGAATAAAAALAEALAARGHDRPWLDELLARGPEWVAGERRVLAALDEEVKAAEVTLAERRRKLESHRATGRPAVGMDDAHARAASAAAERERADADHGAAQLDLRGDDERREAHAALGEELARADAELARWGMLADLIGSHDGRVLRVFAQGLTLDGLLAAANRHLTTLAPRYQLERVPRRDLDLQVVDGDLGNEVRGVNGLSGGESFLVSLALALGLASLSTRRSQARTLFIDEGFGTLDRDTLDQAMAAIDQLRSGNRTVGVISHVPELHERIGVQVTVERVSAGRSRLVVPVASVRDGDGAERRAS